MKSYFSALLGLSLVFLPLNGDEQKPNKWKISAEYLSTGKAEMDNPTASDPQEISYNLGETTISYIHSLDDHNSLVLDLGYSVSEIDWDKNAPFSEDNFEYASIGVGGWSTQMPNWLWRGGVKTQVDPNNFNFTDYALFQGMMWGRYSLSDMMGVHIGLAGSTGLYKDKILPILGVDYTPNKKWHLALVFPVDVSATYTIDGNWSMSASARTFKARHRLSSNATPNKSIFEYRSFGTELSLNYHIFDLESRIFVGSTNSGDVKVMDERGSSPTFYKFKGVAYFGGKLSYKF